MEIGTTLTIAADYTKFIFQDYTDYSGLTLAQYMLTIYKPGASTPYINNLDVAADLQGVAGELRTLYIEPSDLGYSGDVIEDGVYRIIITMRETGETAVTKDLSVLVEKEGAECIEKKIVKLPLLSDEECEKNKFDVKVQAMFLQLEAAKYAVSCGKYTEAQQIYDDLLDYCEDLDCDGCS